MNRSAAYRDMIVVVAGLSIVSLLHYYTDFRLHEAHILYRRLYYLPIIYAAFRFGAPGGALSALASSVLFVPHALMSPADLFGQYGAIENRLEVILFFIVGVTTGLLAGAARRELARSQRFAGELEHAYAHLEQRAIELDRVREYVQSILDSVVSGVITIDRSGAVTMANPAAQRILGLAEAEIEGTPLCDVFVDEGGLCSTVEPLLGEEPGPITGEASVVTRQGRRLALSTHASRLVEHEGALRGAVVTIEDRTEVKALTEQLIRADRLAALGELVAGLAHEIRNPLAIIKGSLQVFLGERGPTERMSEEAAELTRVLNQEIDRLDRVIKALLDFGRPSPAEMRAVDVDKVIAETLTLTGKYALKQGVEVTATSGPPLPEIHADADKLKQVLVNLIQNAVQSMPLGGTVRVGAQRQADGISITVADEGTGITKEELGRVFDPFHTTRDGGTGLGLTIVHRIVDQHNGTIAVDSEPGKGTSITVTLPIGPEAEMSDRGGEG